MIEAFKSDLEQGTTNNFATNSSWTSIGEILSFTPPTQSISPIVPPVPLNGTSRTQTPLPGSATPGTATVVLSYTSGLYDTLKGKQGVLSCFRNKLGASATKAIAFNGWISEIGMPEQNADAFLQITVTIQVQGDADEVAVSA